MIRLGLIGVADPRHRLFLAALLRRRAGVRVVGLGEADPALREEFAVAHDVPAWADHRELLTAARPSLVAVAVPDPGPVVIDALGAGADVLVAPPVCLRSDELAAIGESVRTTGRRVTAVATHRGHPAARTAKELVDAGRLGRPDLVTVIIGPQHDAERLPVTIGEAIDLFGWLTGARPGAARAVSADQAAVDDDPHDATAFGQLIMTVDGKAGGGTAVLEVRCRPDVAASSTIVQVAGADGAVEWDVGSGLLRSAVNGKEPVTVACGPFREPAEWVLNSLLRKPHPEIGTDETLASAASWLALAGAPGDLPPGDALEPRGRIELPTFDLQDRRSAN